MSKMKAAEATGRIEAAFNQAGVRSTPQRFSVMEYLLCHPRHPNVEDLWAALNKRHAKASRATVYNSVHALVQAGLVREFTLDGKAARYEANLEPHHHFVCDECGSMQDVEWFDLPPNWRSQPADQSIRSFEVIFRGVCHKCR